MLPLVKAFVEAPKLQPLIYDSCSFPTLVPALLPAIAVSSTLTAAHLAHCCRQVLLTGLHLKIH